MAALTATLQQPRANLGSMQAMVFEVTASGTAGHINTGLNCVWFAASTSETGTETSDSCVFNSTDGTAGSSMGAVYLPAEDAADVLQVLVIGW